MIVLDTNVISELMKDSPNESVADWITKQNPITLFVSTIVIAEIQRGVLRLPIGKKRDKLANNFIRFIENAFNNRILSFDEQAAYIFGDLASERERAGFNTDSVDLMIAAIVKSNHATIATRNTKDFKDCGIAIINPWSGH